jgi:hypothetical protein
MPNPHTIRNEAGALAAVRKDGYALRYVREPTEAVCLAAVRKDGYALRYVREPTEAVCLAAVRKDGDALQYVRDDALYDKLEQFLKTGCMPDSAPASVKERLARLEALLKANG